jgi:hypothetical protein
MAWTSTGAAGAKLRAADLTTAFVEVRPTSILKGADEIVSNSTTLQDDDELVLAVAANTTYRWFADINYGAGAAADYKWGFTFPAAATLTFVGAGWDAALAFLPSGNGGTYASGTGIVYGGAGVATIRGLILRGTLVTGANAGNWRYQWAQNTPTVENTVTKAGSLLTLQKLS